LSNSVDEGHVQMQPVPVMQIKESKEKEVVRERSMFESDRSMWDSRRGGSKVKKTGQEEDGVRNGRDEDEGESRSTWANMVEMPERKKRSDREKDEDDTGTKNQQNPKKTIESSAKTQLADERNRKRRNERERRRQDEKRAEDRARQTDPSCSPLAREEAEQENDSMEDEQRRKEKETKDEIPKQKRVRRKKETTRDACGLHGEGGKGREVDKERRKGEAKEETEDVRREKRVDDTTGKGEEGERSRPSK
jgi:hypothetical protein